jgi:hypothetical protein
MAVWAFSDYITEDGVNLISDWYDAQDPEVQAQFDVALYILGATEDWEQDGVEEWFKPLLRRHAGLGEVRFYIDAKAPGAKKPRRRRFRPAGVWPTPIGREFILILGCEKRGMTYMPHDAFGLALRHKALLEQGRGTTREHT